MIKNKNDKSTSQSISTVKWNNPFFMVVAVALGFYLLLRFAVQPPLPSTLVTMYMVTVVFALILYVASSEKTFREFNYPINLFLKEDKFKVPRLTAGIIIPLLAAWFTYSSMTPSYSPPAELRTVHPTPPGQIIVQGEEIKLSEARNPFRTPEKRKQAVEEGREIYFGNCMPCHGANLSGKGHWVKRLNPIPINFRDPGTIAMMTESFIFWRVAKGGIGLPDEGTPWNSAMPKWEEELTNEEMWKVVLYIYDETGFEPRSWEETKSEKE